MENENFIITKLKAHDGITNLIDCEFIEIDSNTRLYYKNEVNKDFFGFDCVTVISNLDLLEDVIWRDNNTQIMYLFKGTAMFDGIRHIYFGIEKDEECNGYLYYPNIDLMIKALVELKKLEIKYCPQL